MPNNYAEFHKCALQVNPYDYIKYRGAEHSFNEEDYNNAIYKNCLSAGIKVVGLANHGDVKSSANLREYLVNRGIVVFPGFEISTSERVHIVCLFDENTTETQLERYLGRLDITDTNDGVSPSKLSFNQIAAKIDEFGGFWYAAHVTQDNGVLKNKQYPIWQSDYLIAAQIPAKRHEVEHSYLSILQNKDPNYKKERPFALINAKDINEPEDILHENASCLVKMSDLNFHCFKLAFKDPNARVRLTSDINTVHQSTIDEIRVFGGYLDDFKIRLSPNLNTIIGGRGTGKSTLIELIRYSFEQSPKGTEAKKHFDKIIEANLGDGGRVELFITSHKQYGEKFKIVKRYGNPVVIKTLNDSKSKFSLNDIFPNVEIYSQNEIVEITDNENAKLQILDRFLESTQFSIEKSEKIKLIKANSSTLLKKLERLDELSSKINKLPSLNEKKDSFNKLGISEKLEIQGQLTTEEGYIKTSKTRLDSHSIVFPELSVPFDKEFIDKTKNSSIFLNLKQELDKFNDKISSLSDEYNHLKLTTLKVLNSIDEQWIENKQNAEADINRAIKALGELGGKSGPEIAKDFTDTLSEIAEIEPLSTEVSLLESEIELLQGERANLLEELNTIADSELDALRRVIKNINKKKLKGKVKIEIHPKGNKEYLIDFLLKEKGLGFQSLKWLEAIETFSMQSFIENIKKGKESLYNAYKEYGLQQSKAEILANMSKERIFELEVIELPNIIDIQLNVSSNSNKYKSLSDLSKGQQCTAILNILLLDNNDPLIVDQPEDNLDNAYIANNLVEGLRNLKINRQFLFATHNANIPVFGDAELIGVMQEIDGQGSVNQKSLGSVDSKHVKEAVIDTLEGGSTAFTMRKEKYDI